MATITIRNLDDQLGQQLRLRAAEHGRSTAEEAREILRLALAETSATPQNLAEILRHRFAELGGIELPTEPREQLREPPSFDR
jgi:plasmid stability protein